MVRLRCLLSQAIDVCDIEVIIEDLGTFHFFDIICDIRALSEYIAQRDRDDDHICEDDDEQRDGSQLERH